MLTEIAALPSRPTVERIAGADRYAVSAAVLAHPRYGLPESAASRVYVASGQVFPDALTGSVLAGTAHAPIVLAPTHCLHRDDALYLGTITPAPITLLGGRSTLTSSLDTLTHCT